jgi:hypothetical protein
MIRSPSLKTANFFVEAIMRIKNTAGIVLIGLFLCTGCAKRALVTYNQVEETNYVEVTLLSGEKVEGSATKMEPHQLTIRKKNRELRVIPKSSVRTIKRKPPIIDDFGKGISEEEIRSTQTSRHTVIYGIGGGALSVGASFFVGSLIANSSEKSGGTALAASTAAGGGLGTFLFVRAGKKKDRKEAIERIREERRSTEIKEDPNKEKTQDALKKQLEDEKRRQESLRQEREKLLRELEQKKKKKIEE